MPPALSASGPADEPPSSGPPNPKIAPLDGESVSPRAKSRDGKFHVPRAIILISFAIATVAIVLSALTFSGVLTPTTPAVTSTTFRPAWADANRSTNDLNGTAWDLVSAMGYDSPNSLTVGIGNFTGGCLLSPASGSSIPTVVNLPAFSGKLASGSSPAWLLAYEQLATAQIYLVAIVNGATLPIGEETASCFDPTSTELLIPEGSLDSSTVAPVAADAGGSEYLSAHPNAFLEMSILGGLPGGPPVNPGPFWTFVYSPCNPLGSDGPVGIQSALDIELSALNGTILALGNTTVNCQGSGAGIALSSSLAFGNVNSYAPQPSEVAGECGAGDYCYSIALDVVSNTLTAGDFRLEMTTNTGLLLTIGGFYIDGSNSSQGYLIGGAGANPSDPWVTVRGTITPSTALAPGDTIWIDVSPMSPSGENYSLSAIGLGSFSGSTSTILP